MPTAPTPITPLGTPPSSADPTNFDARADALMGQLPTLVTQTNDVATNAYGNAVEAASSATAAQTARAGAESARDVAIANAQAAASSAGATAWVSGSTYALGVRVWSPIDQQLYRRFVPGAGTTDPSMDTTNWARVWVVPKLVTARSFYL